MIRTSSPKSWIRHCSRGSHKILVILDLIHPCNTTAKKIKWMKFVHPNEAFIHTQAVTGKQNIIFCWRENKIIPKFFYAFMFMNRKSKQIIIFCLDKFFLFRDYRHSPTIFAAALWGMIFGASDWGFTIYAWLYIHKFHLNFF